MLGAIVGDILGSPYEGKGFRDKEIKEIPSESRFTDDTVLTCAVAYALLKKKNYCNSIREFFMRYPNAGYGRYFIKWAREEGECPSPYGSWGNGAAMRISPIGFVYNDKKLVLKEAEKCTEITHNTKEAIEAAQAVALTIFYARKGENKERIKEELFKDFSFIKDSQEIFNLKEDQIRKTINKDYRAGEAVLLSLWCLFNSSNFKDSILLALRNSNDTDTISAITGSMAHALYKKIPLPWVQFTRKKLDPFLLQITEEFCKTYCTNEERETFLQEEDINTLTN